MNCHVNPAGVAGVQAAFKCLEMRFGPRGVQPMIKKEMVTIEDDGEPATHIKYDITGGYLTLCGFDGDDAECGQKEVETPKGAKVDCWRCIEIWKRCQQWRKSDFSM